MSTFPKCALTLLVHHQSSTIMGGNRLLFTWKFVVFPPVTVQIVDSYWSRWLDYPFWPWNRWTWKSLWWHIPHAHHPPPLEDDFGWTSWHVIPIPISHWRQTWEAWENQNWSKSIDIHTRHKYLLQQWAGSSDPNDIQTWTSTVCSSKECLINLYA